MTKLGDQHVIFFSAFRQSTTAVNLFLNIYQKLMAGVRMG